MVILQSTHDGRQYRAVITSEQKIFATVEDLWRLADENGIDPEIVREQMQHDEFPSAINHDNGIDGRPEDGVWMYDRVEHFIEWLSSNPAYNRRISSATKTEV